MQLPGKCGDGIRVERCFGDKLAESVNGTQRTKKDDSVALKHKVTKPDAGPDVVQHKERRLAGNTSEGEIKMEPNRVNNPWVYLCAPKMSRTMLQPHEKVGLKEFVETIQLCEAYHLLR